MAVFKRRGRFKSPKYKNVKQKAVYLIHLHRFKLKVHTVINIVIYWYIEALHIEIVSTSKFWYRPSLLHIKYDKQSLWNQRGHCNDLNYCVYYSVVHITMICLNVRDNIYFVMIFSQLLQNNLLSLVSLIVKLFKKKDWDSFPKIDFK